MNGIIIFALATVINVLLSTIRSLMTIKGTPLVASCANAVCYGFYTWIIVLTSNGNVDLLWKIGITALANFVGVFAVKLVEKKLTKDKLWKVDFTVNHKHFKIIEDTLKELDIPYHYNEYGKHTMFGAFCQTQDDTVKVANLVKLYDGKYFISENKGILE